MNSKYIMNTYSPSDLTFDKGLGSWLFDDKGYKYLDEAIELATELGLNISDHEIIRTNSTGLVIYNPKNLAERIKGMKNTEKTREQKIAERVAYMQQNKTNSDNLN